MSAAAIALAAEGVVAIGLLLTFAGAIILAIHNCVSGRFR